MKTLVLISVLVAAATAQYFPVGGPFLNRFPSEDQYAASLGGAPVGLYDKKSGLGYGPYGGYGSEVVGASLGGAKVGLYGKENQRGVPQQFPLPVPLPFPYYPVRPGLPYGRPVRPRVVV